MALEMAHNSIITYFTYFFRFRDLMVKALVRAVMGSNPAEIFHSPFLFVQSLNIKKLDKDNQLKYKKYTVKKLRDI